MSITVQTIPLDDLPRPEWKRTNRPLKTPAIFDFAGHGDIQDGDRVTITYDNRKWRGIVVKHGDGWRFVEDVNEQPV